MKASLILGHFLIAGVDYQDAQKINWHKLDPASPVHLRRERFNSHDPLCVSIRLEDDVRIGYVRREDNRILSALMDQDASLTARFIEIDIDPHADQPNEVRIEVALQPPDSLDS